MEPVPWGAAVRGAQRYFVDCGGCEEINEEATDEANYGTSANGVGSSSIASITLSSVSGRPSRTLSAPKEFGLPAGALRSIFVDSGFDGDCWLMALG